MSLFSNIFKAVKTVVEEIRTVPITQLMLDIVGYVPGVIKEIMNVIDMNQDGLSKEELKKLIDDSLLEFDNITGIEGFTIIPGMNKEREEETLDALSTVIRNLCYMKLDAKFNE